MKKVSFEILQKFDQLLGSCANFPKKLDIGKSGVICSIQVAKRYQDMD